MQMKQIIIVTLVCLALVAGVLLLVHPSYAGKTLLVHAGAGIRPALDELGAEFQKKTGTRVDYNYKGSACLLPDVCVSRKGDAYIPGELYFMQQAVDRKLVAPGFRIVASMTTVIVAQPGNPKGIASARDLGKPGVRLGLGDPEAVAIGRAARECLVKAGVWEAARKNLVMSAQNVTELSNAVKMQQIDAAVVWNATAALYTDRELATVPIEEMQATCSPVPVGMLVFSKNPRETREYMDFLASPRGREIFLKHGFGPPVKDPAECKTDSK